jgi:CheY-like chemotaxis protein
MATAYLDIERARFGERLHVETPSIRGACNQLIPNLILQPLVENAVKHGLSRKLGTGTIRIDAVLDDGCLSLTVGDDGLGMPRPALERVYDRGVGLRNLRDRLERLYGPAHLPEIRSAPGGGTEVRYASPSSRSVSPRDGWTRIRRFIIDDEKLARDRLAGFLAHVARRRGRRQAQDGVEALELIERERPDLVFLDVQMPGMDGFEVLKALRAPRPHVVFATAYDEYAIRAFEVGAVDYLLKPFARARVEEAVGRARARLGNERKSPTGTRFSDGSRSGAPST